MALRAVIFDFGQVLNAPTDPQAVESHRAVLAEKLKLSPDDLWPYLFEGEPGRRWMTG